MTPTAMAPDLVPAPARPTASVKPGSEPTTLSSWSAPIVSTLVLGIFAAAMLLVLVHGVPPGTEAVANILLGTLSAMATSVVSYWVGSSAGSARKDERLAQAAQPQAAQPQAARPPAPG